MARVILGHRASGKTTELINRANEIHRYGETAIVISTNSERSSEWYHSHGLIAEIPVLSYHQYNLNRPGNPQYDNAHLFIDDIVYFLERLLNNRLEGITIDLEDCMILLRGDRL